MNRYYQFIDPSGGIGVGWNLPNLYPAKTLNVRLLQGTSLSRFVVRQVLDPFVLLNTVFYEKKRRWLFFFISLFPPSGGFHQNVIDATVAPKD